MRNFDVVQDEVRDAEHEGQGFEFHAVNSFFERLEVFEILDVLSADVFDGAGEEAAGAAGGVEDFFTEAGIDGLGHKLGDGAGRVEFTIVTRAL